MKRNMFQHWHSHPSCNGLISSTTLVHILEDRKNDFNSFIEALRLCNHFKYFKNYQIFE